MTIEHKTCSIQQFAKAANCDDVEYAMDSRQKRVGMTAMGFGAIKFLLDDDAL
jgi:hypothetical protein